MVYTLLLWRHPNIHYRRAVVRLSRCELLSMLKSLSIEASPVEEAIGSADLLTFESRPLTDRELSFLAGHSCAVLISEKNGAMLHPLSAQSGDLFPEDLPEILKYKGKTNPSFTRMMLNTALSLSSFAHESNVTVLDPLSGRGTTLFCALCMGANAVGLETDHRDLKETSDYFSRYLKTARIKFSCQSFSSTVGKMGIPGKKFTFIPPGNSAVTGESRTMTLYEGDTSLCGQLLRKHPVHLLAADLPYGIQHAPQNGRKPETFSAFLNRVLPSWKLSLRPGAAIALSFNTLTLKSDDVRAALQDAGFSVCEAPEFTVLAHQVEQAVIRDVVFAHNPL